MLDLNSLYKLKDMMIESNSCEEDMVLVNEMITSRELLLEDTSGGGLGAPSGGGVAMGNASTAGMGPIISNQPSGNAGATNGADWISKGGTEGSGDIAVPFNPSGGNKLFHNIKKPKSAMGKNHGAQTGQKPRKKPLSRKMIQDMMKKKGQKSGKIVGFDAFTKAGMDQVTKVKEGKAFQASRNQRKDNTKYDKSDQMKLNVITHAKSFMGTKIKEVGNDIEIIQLGDRLAQVMFRDKYVGVKGEGSKFANEYSYSELGKIKKDITNIIQNQD
jgi:hypothetical protein